MVRVLLVRPLRSPLAPLLLLNHLVPLYLVRPLPPNPVEDLAPLQAVDRQHLVRAALLRQTHLANPSRHPAQILLTAPLHLPVPLVSRQRQLPIHSANPRLLRRLRQTHLMRHLHLVRAPLDSLQQRPRLAKRPSQPIHSVRDHSPPTHSANPPVRV